MGQFPLEQWFYEMPVCTRWWTVATVATSLLVQCHIITPFQLFYSYRAVFVKNQVLERSSRPHSSSSKGHPHQSNNPPSSIGASSPHSYISGPSPSTSSSMSSSYNATRASSRNRPAAPPPGSHGCSSTPPRSSSVSRPYSLSHFSALPSVAVWFISGPAAIRRPASASSACWSSPPRICLGF